ncbi:PBECR4 domain-containing protein [Peribacillus sp. AS_2]|uniref:PBECR4 domain-containing protein n=1 Tax=Peribacillus sp. AS_2 TaxID=2996755 RepID=UPI0022A698A4|nr:PBECR4 domain-containing protein [Peribacillus sp. AS_2]MCZ0875631.1 PBECR4 domain-containing protein [Peribacillus sp. AS_2]
MVLTCQQLFNATQNPRINDLTLDLLREYYETHLHPYIFQFEIKDDVGNSSETIELRFDQENFCHLLGIHKIVERTVNRNAIFQYKGQAGWDNVVKGTITFDLLREKKTKKQFTSRKEKYVFFYLIPKLIESPKGVLYDAAAVPGNTLIDCEILFYDNLQSAYVHIGIKKDEDLGYYIPKTFFVEKITSNKDGMKYVANQKEIIVTKLDKKVIEVE